MYRRKAYWMFGRGHVESGTYQCQYRCHYPEAWPIDRPTYRYYISTFLLFDTWIIFLVVGFNFTLISRTMSQTTATTKMASEVCHSHKGRDHYKIVADIPVRMSIHIRTNSLIITSLCVKLNKDCPFHILTSFVLNVTRLIAKKKPNMNGTSKFMMVQASL